MTTPVYNIADTWNDGGTVFTSIKMVITDTASAAGSKLIDITSSTGANFSISKEGHIAFSGHLDFTPGAAPAWEEGLMYYDSAEKAMSYYNDAADVTINIGQESVLRVINNTGGAIANGKAVYISGAAAGVPEITKSISTSAEPSVRGITTNDMNDAATGYVTTFGVVRGIDTSGFNVNDRLFVSDSVAGDIVNVAPALPARSPEIGVVLTSAVDGKIFVDVKADLQGVPSFKSYTFVSRDTATGENYEAGFYYAPAADLNLTNASPTGPLGTANVSYAAHVFIVAAAPGVTDGSDLVLTVSGTSMTDAGVRVPGDSEVVVVDCTAVATNEYYETSKKFIGATVLTLSSTGGTAFNFDFNYGLAKYDDMGNRSFTVTDIECVGYSNLADSGFNIEFLHHKATGWTYSAAAFQPGATPIYSMNVDHNTEINVGIDEPFAWKRGGLALAINGSDSEGFLIRVTNSVNRSISYMDTHIGVLFG